MGNASTIGDQSILEKLWQGFYVKQNTLPVGKLPTDILAHCLSQTPVDDLRVIVGPGIGLDCAVVEVGSRLWVIKSDPITFATDQIGWYVVQINANDIATAGAIPRWLIVTILLPEHKTTAALAEQIHKQIYNACQDIDVSLIGGHTEITYGLDRPIVVGALIGEVDRDHLITPLGASPGDRILLTKGVPIEATALLSREFPDRLCQVLTPDEIIQANAFLHEPGISILPDARIAIQAGKVTAMHDPTEGGLSTALWELAQASGCRLMIDLEAVHIYPLSVQICQVFQIDPLAAISSGALLLTTPAGDAQQICRALNKSGILCHEIGEVEAGEPTVLCQTSLGYQKLPYPSRDAVAQVLSS